MNFYLGSGLFHMTGFFQLAGQVAIVTGGGNGIGAGIARRLHAAGARIAVFDSDEAAAKTVADDIAGLAIAGSVTREGDVAEAIRHTEVALGPISILINNAGIAGRNDLSWKLSVDEVRSVFDVNFIGTFL